MSEYNAERVFLPLDLRMLIQQDCGKDFRSATIILRILTEHYKDRLDPEVYEELKERYSMNVFEQRELKIKKKREREVLKRSKEFEKIEKRLKDVNLILSRVKEGTPRHKQLSEEKERLLEQLSGD